MRFSSEVRVLVPDWAVVVFMVFLQVLGLCL